MSQVFISYKREEKSSAFVLQLKEKLETAGFDVWIDQSLLRPGQLWIQEIDNAIKASIALIVVLTPEAHQSLYVTYEWSFAVGRGMPIIPLLLEETEIHRRLQDIQFIDFRNHWALPWEDLISLLQELETGITGKHKEIPPFVQRAVDALDSYEIDDRMAALKRLTYSNHPAAVEALANAVVHHLKDVRVNAGFKLAEVSQYKDARAVKGLIEAMTYGGYYDKAIEYLGKIGTREAIVTILDTIRGKEIYDLNIWITQEETYNLTMQAIRVLGALKNVETPDGLLFIQEALHDSDKSVCEIVQLALVDDTPT